MSRNFGRVIFGTLPVLGLAITLATDVFAQTRLGLHVTQEELNIWKQRAQSGPYKSAGDVQTNSPGDWTRIQNNANTFLANPSAERWSGQPTGSCWSSSVGTPVTPAITWGERLRDAGFAYLITGTTSYRDAVRNELLAQAGTAGTNWTDTIRWSATTGCATGDAYSHEIMMWIVKLLYGYDYIRSSLSAADRTTLDTWFLNGGIFWEKVVDNLIKTRFPNRDSDNYSVYNTAYDPNGDDGSPAEVTHFGGYVKHGWMEAWNNRNASQVMMFGLVGILTNNSNLKSQSQRYFKEWMQYGVFADGTNSDFSRSVDDNVPAAGWYYGGSMANHMAILADAFARAGDLELYQYSTSNGKYGTAGGPKTLNKVVRLYMNYVDHSVLRYGTADPAKNGDPSWLQDSDDEITGQKRIHDTWFAPVNIYFKDNYITNVYTRKAPGQNGYTTPGYPATVAAGFCPYCGVQGTFPGVLFMFGQMEGKVSPYGTGGSPPPPSPPAAPSSVVITLGQ